MQKPFLLDGYHSFNPSNLINMNNFLLNQHHLLSQQLLLQREYLKTYLHSAQFQYYQALKNSSLQKIQNSPCYAFSIETPQKNELDLAKSETDNIPYKIEEDESKSQSVMTKEDNGCKEDVRAQIARILEFFITEFGKISSEETDKERSKYYYNRPLLELFDSLKAKYLFTTKSREDIMRFILRKAMTYLRDDTRKKEGLTAKAASIALCKRYFDVKLDEEGATKEQVKVKNEKDLMSVFLPYKKNSRNKTANSRFIREIFGSEAFYQDYLVYFDKLDEILEDENQKKIDKFTDFLVECVQKNSLHKIKEFKRVPWLKVWQDETKSIAKELLNIRKPSQEKSIITDFKKLKTYQ